ncbi:MAG: TetR/AcrR family transcriptional regulator [Oscillospiraceae bacterium]|nr:TetR/AcrR family transcriptional regulator [Oscillospiraceae bacterium]
MPPTTFFNLPPPKREKLLRAAVAEFARKPYGEVSINRIIQAAEIPRGSFYQYFSDKTDLFRYVLQCYSERMQEFLSESLSRCGGRLTDLPLVSFDLVLEYQQKDTGELRTFLSILRQNMELNASEVWSACPLVQMVLERADFSRIALQDPEERRALVELLLGVTGQALAAAACGKLTAEESRSHLASKIAIIRRGAENKEEPC